MISGSGVVLGSIVPEGVGVGGYSKPGTATLGSLGGSGEGEGVGALGSGVAVALSIVAVGVGVGVGLGVRRGVGVAGLLVGEGEGVGLCVGVGVGLGVLVGQKKDNSVSSALDIFGINKFNIVTEHRIAITKVKIDAILFFLFFRLKVILISQHLPIVYVLNKSSYYKMSNVKYNRFFR